VVGEWPFPATKYIPCPGKDILIFAPNALAVLDPPNSAGSILVNTFKGLPLIPNLGCVSSYQ
jgi:hypothetical protein